jgi:hypothetical protein
VLAFIASFGRRWRFALVGTAGAVRVHVPFTHGAVIMLSVNVERGLGKAEDALRESFCGSHRVSSIYVRIKLGHYFLL